MPRPRGGHLTARASTPTAVRIPNQLLQQAMVTCGGKKHYPAWVRNLIRRACSVPLDYEAGYDEGFRAGWSEAKARFQAALKEKLHK